jgi:hypothetical protein
LSRVGRDSQVSPMIEAPVREAAGNIVRVSLLRRLAVMTVIVTIAAALLDYVFKAMATEVVRRPDDLARLFAMFHGLVGVMTALVQWVFGRWALQNLGLARTLATLPGAVIAFGAAAVIAPGIGTFVALRGAENVLRNSLYREAYEVFYTPLLSAERRATKTIIDVGVERFGDVLGGVAVLAIIAIAAPPTMALLLGAIILSAIGMIVALPAQQSYVEALERSLLAHAIDFERDEPRDRTTRATVELVSFRARTDPDGASVRAPATEPASDPYAVSTGRWLSRARARDDKRVWLDPSLRRLVDLNSSEPDRVRNALAESLLSPAAVAYAITLLGRPDVAEAAATAILKVAGPCIGQIADAMRDPQLAVSVRAQLPRLIVQAADSRARAEVARAGLATCRADPESEIRARAAEALARLRDDHPGLALDERKIFDGVRRELAGLAAPAIATRSPEAIHHLATLLALALPAEPIRTAFHGLHSDDPSLRGVALEYLENVLPGDICDRMLMVLAVDAPAQLPKRPIEDVLAELLQREREREPSSPSPSLRASRAR